MKSEGKKREYLLTPIIGVLSCYQQTCQASVLRDMLNSGGFLLFRGTQ